MYIDDISGIEGIGLFSGLTREERHVDWLGAYAHCSNVLDGISK